MHHAAKLSRVVLLLLLSLLSAVSQMALAKGPIVGGDGPLPTVGEYPDYLIDPKGDFTLDQVRAMELPAHSKRNPSFGWIKDVVWLATDIDKRDDKKYILEIGYPLLDFVTVSIFRDEQLVKTLILGDSVKNSEGVLDSIEPAFYLPEQAGQYRIIMRIATSSSVQAPMKIYDEASFNVKGKNDFLATGIYTGILGIMGFYNLFIFFASRNRAYLSYSLFVFVFLLLQLSLSGHTYHYIWPSHPHISDVMICQGGILATLSMVLFSNQYLGMQKKGPKRKWTVLSVVSMLLATFAVSWVIPYVIAVKLMAVTAVLSVSCMLGTATYQMVKGQREAKFYFVAWSVFITGCVIYIGKQLGLLPVSFVTHYSFKIGSVVEVALLSLALADQLNVMRADLKRANSELKDLNENLEQKVVEKTRDIKSILANLHLGIFQVKNPDHAYIIDSEYSTHLEKMVPDSKLAGANPMQAIFDRTNLSDNDRSMVASVFESSINEDALNFEVNEHTLPRELMIGDRFIEVDWVPVKNENDVIQKILVTMKDVTDLRQYQLAAMKQAREFQTLGEIAQQDATKMQEFIKVCEELFQSSMGQLDWMHPNALALVFRNLHTVKGLARNFDLKSLTNSVHEAEQEIKNLQGKALSPEALAVAQGKIDESYKVFEEYKRINNEVLGREKLADKVVMDKIELRDIQKKLHNIRTLNELKEIESRILFMFEAKLEQVVGDEVALLGSICRSLSKPLPVVLFQNDEYIIPANIKTPIRKAFVHLLRNSMDHGIEGPDERKGKGKEAEGRINIAIEEHDQHLTIRYSDDGRGLALSRILDKAKKQGMVAETQQMSRAEIAELIFASGFSTAEKTTDISGRGVGMDAVRSYIEEVGGTVKIEVLEGGSVDFAPIAFVLTLPYNPMDMAEAS